MNPKQEQRLNELKEHVDDWCLLDTEHVFATTNRDRKPCVSIDGEVWTVARWLLDLKPGSPLQANHLCHTAACINVGHLYRGTQTQNMRDRFDDEKLKKIWRQRHPHAL